MDPRECVKCKKKYIPVKHNQIYCPVCKANKTTVPVLRTITCVICGTEFSSAIYNRKYCSKTCLDISKRDMTRETDHTCKHCGKVYRSTRINQLYCSKECAAKVKAAYDKKWREAHAVSI